jgi:serine/threonine protein kinase
VQKADLYSLGVIIKLISTNTSLSPLFKSLVLSMVDPSPIKRASFDQIMSAMLEIQRILRPYSIDPSAIGIDTKSSVNGMQIFVNTLCDKTFIVHAEDGDSVQKLKEKIFNQSGLEPEAHHLLFAGKQMEEHRLVTNYHIQDSSTLHLVERKTKMPLNIRTPTKTIRGTVDLRGSVLSVKRMIAATNSEWPIDEQCLMLGDIELDDDRCINDYQIEVDSLQLSLRGPLIGSVTVGISCIIPPDFLDLPTRSEGYQYVKLLHDETKAAIYRVQLTKMDTIAPATRLAIKMYKNSSTLHHQNELDFYERSSHRKILTPYQWFVDTIPTELSDTPSTAKALFMVMESLPLSLAAVLRSRSSEALTFHEILHLAHDMIAVIGHLQKEQIAHLNIKPDNILIRLPSDVTRDSALTNLEQPGIEFVLSDFGKFCLRIPTK